MSLNETSKKNYILELALEADNKGKLFRRENIEQCRQTYDCYIENSLWKDYRQYLMEQFQTASDYKTNCQGLNMSVENGHYFLTVSGREFSVTLEKLANQIKLVDNIIQHVDINTKALTLGQQDLVRFKDRVLQNHKSQLLSNLKNPRKESVRSEVSAFATGVTVTSIIYLTSQLLFQRRW